MAKKVIRSKKRKIKRILNAARPTFNLHSITPL